MIQNWNIYEAKDTKQLSRAARQTGAIEQEEAIELIAIYCSAMSYHNSI